MRFGLLGPLLVTSNGAELAVSGAKRRALLTRLLLDANRAVAAERLVEDLWEGSPPPTAAGTLQSHVSHLRRIVGSRLRTVPGGYACDVGDDELDVWVFEAEAAEARRLLSTEPQRAGELAARALARWRGPALADAGGAAWATSEAARLEELRLLAVECDLEARLALGHPADVVARAEAAVIEHPLREQLWALLVTALYRSGRQAEALRAYGRLRRRLVDELGIDPSPALQALERGVLAQDPSLSQPVHAPAGPTPTASADSTVQTFLMTDIVGSTRMWEAAPEAMRDALARHDEILRRAIAQHHGRVFATGGDGLCAVFSSALDAAAAARDAQAGLARELWPDPAEIRVRMALHTGPAQQRGGDFFGPAVNRCARLMAIAHGGQVLCTRATAELLEDAGGFALVDLGPHRLRDLLAPVPVIQLGEGTFPRLRSLESVPTNLPTGLTDLVGRADEVAALSEEVRHRRVVTLTGAGGVGKTRLALTVGAAVANDFFDGTWLVELAAVSHGDDVAAAVTTALAAPRLPGCDALTSLLAYLADRRLVLILDNCEHLVAGVAEVVATVTSTTADVHVLVTSREPLGVDGEVVRGVPPLELPDEDVSADEAEQVAAVRLFVDRARAASDQFVLDDTNVAAVSDICRRLDGVPLAIELGAARVRTMTPADIAARLHDRFRLLTGLRRNQERHRTLLATVAWSYDLLSADEQQVFAQLSVFPSTFDLAAAAAVVRVGGLGADDVVDAVLRLVDRSLVVHVRASGRYRVLETLRHFGSERLTESGVPGEVVDRYVAHFVDLVCALSAGLVDHRHDTAVAALAAELDNVRSVIDLLMRLDRWDDVGRVTLAGWQFFTQFTPLETKSALALALERGGLPHPEQQAEAASVMALMAANTGDADEATGQARLALELSAVHGFSDPPWALFALSMVASTFASDWGACLAHAQGAVAAAAARGDGLARIAALAQSVPALLRQGRPDEADAAATEAVEAAARLRNTTALSVAVICTCAGYCLDPDHPDLARARAVLDRHGDAAIGPYGGLNTAWLLTYRALAESGRDARRAIGFAVEAARVADRSSPFALSGAVQVLTLACARAGLVAEARALDAYVAAHGALPFDRSDSHWLTHEVRRAIGAENDSETVVPVPRGRRELLSLLSTLEQRLGRS